MQNENATANQGRTRKRRKSRRGRRKNKALPENSTAPETPAADFSLLADPATIAGTSDASSAEGGAVVPDTAPDERETNDHNALAEVEAERLRSALQLQSAEIATLNEKWIESTVSSEAPTVAENPEPRRALLDAASARRLAADARARERASREALAAAQQAYSEARSPADEAPLAEPLPGPEPNPAAPDSATQPVSSTPVDTGWQRQSLVSNKATRASSERLSNRAPTPDLAQAPAPVADPAPEIRKALAAAEAEVRELQSTLNIARDTTQGQRRTIDELRNRLEEAARVTPEEIAAPLALQNERTEQLDSAKREIGRLSEHIERLDRDVAEHASERLALEQELARRDALLAARNTELDALRDRFEVQDRALDAARHEYEVERRRHSQSLDLLARLRSTLSLAPSSVEARSDRDAPHARDRAESSEVGPVPNEWTQPASLTAPSAPQTPTLATSEGVPESQTPATPEYVPEGQTLATPEYVPEGQTLATSEGIRAGTTFVPEPAHEAVRAAPFGPLFDAWQDDQIRRHFGPMGIDTFAELLRAPLSRRESSNGAEKRILLIGRGAWNFAARLTEDLVANGTDAFAVYVADSLGALPAACNSLPADAPVRDYLYPEDFPVTPGSFEELLERLSPDAILCRDFLSHEPDPEAWLQCLERSAQGGSCLLFSERTGVTTGAPPPEMREIGERIWELMPERYTRLPNGHERIPSWAAGFESAVTPPANQLGAAIRKRFDLEMISQFGFLAEPFLGSAISSNFDPTAPRDLRFIHQVADLDERKIESGIAQALHLVALVDPLSEHQEAESRSHER